MANLQSIVCLIALVISTTPMADRPAVGVTIVPATGLSQNANRPTETTAENIRLIDGLRARRLFGLAQTHCENLLASDELTPTQESTFTIELIKTQTSAAILSTGPSRESDWQSATQTANQFLTDYPQHPRRLLILVQSGLSQLAHGRLLRQELDAEMIPAEQFELVRDAALEQLRFSRSQLAEVQREILKKIPEQRNRTLGDGELSAEELMALNNNVLFQLAINNVNRAQLYRTDDRLNRIDALAGVLKRLTEVKSQTSPGEPLWWESQTLQIQCLRLLGENGEAQSILKRLTNLQDDPDSPPAPQSLLEQQLQLSIATGDREGLLSGLRAAESVKNRTPELDLARLESVMDLVSRTGDQEKQQWLTQAAQMTRDVERNHGAYWGRRAELALIGSGRRTDFDPSDSRTHQPHTGGGTDATSAELDLMVRLAEQAMRKNQLDDGLKAYDRATGMAKQLGNSEQAFTLAVRASQALEQNNRHAEASNRLVALSLLDPQYKLAPAAHLRGCWNWAQLSSEPKLQEQESQPEKFVQLLKQHLHRWPDDDSANQVHLWLAGQRQTNSQWKQALESYAQIKSESPWYDDAILRSVYCAKQYLATLDVDQRQSAAIQISNQLASIVESSDPDSSAHFEAVLAETEIGILYATRDTSHLLAPLKSLIDHSSDARQQNLGRAWLLVVLAFDPTLPADGETEIAPLRDAINQDKTLLAIADQGLLAVYNQRPELKLKRFDPLRLKLIESAMKLSLDERETTAWQYRKSEVLANLGANESALAVLRELEKQSPRNAGIQLQIARLMSRIYESSEPERPLTQWRKLTSQLKPHTESWYEAKYHVASLLVVSGKKQEAKKMLEYLQAIPPGWKNSGLKTKFEQLLEKCR